MRKWLTRAGAMLALCCVLSTTAALAAGSGQGPLITLSYLNDTFMDTIMTRVDQKIAARLGQGGTGGASASFSVVDLAGGQTLTGGIGCEVMLRVGSAVCVSPASPGLIDETGGTVLNSGGALVQNHMYMMTIEGRGVKASSAVKLLVRGSYSIG